MGILAINGGNPVRKKPFTGWPIWDEAEHEALKRVIESSKWGSLHGEEVAKFEKEFARFHDVTDAVAVTNGEAALRIAYRSMEIKQGDEVIIPAYTFFGSATPALELGANLRFIDVLPDTYNIDPELIEEAITDRTKMIIAVHFAGLPARMKEINQIAEKYNLKVVEDAAQAWGSKRYGKSVGTFAPLAAFSFQSSKNITSGEGGILTIRDTEFSELVRSLSNNGRRKDGKWYEHYEIAGNYRMTEFQGAILRVQFARYQKYIEIREKRAEFLRSLLSPVEGIKPLSRPEDVDRSSNHIFIFKYDKKAFGNLPKDKFIEALQAEGIPAITGYVIPLYKQPALLGKNEKYGKLNLPVTERACHEEAIWLRHSLLLDSEEDLADIKTAIEKIQKNQKELTD